MAWTNHSKLNVKQTAIEKNGHKCIDLEFQQQQLRDRFLCDQTDKLYKV